MKDNNTDQEDIILKKIRYYQGSIEDFENFWNRKIEQGRAEESKETKSLKKVNDDLNKDYTIIPVTEKKRTL